MSLTEARTTAKESGHPGAGGAALVAVVAGAGLRERAASLLAERFEVAEGASAGELAAIVQARAVACALIAARLDAGDGPAALAALRELPGGAALPVVVLLEPGDAEAAFAMGALGAQAHLMAEDLTAEALAEAVARARSAPPPPAARAAREAATFAAAFRAGPLILSITRASDGRFVEVNDRFEAVSGYSRAEVIGRTPIELGLWVRPEQRSSGLRQLGQGASLREIEADFRVRDGRVITCLAAADRIEAGGEECILTALVDITERKQAEQILSRYHLLSEQTRDIVLFIRTDGQIVEANAAAVAAYGYDYATLLTCSIGDLRDPAALSDLGSQMAAAERGGILFETSHRRADGSVFPVEVSSIGADVGGERLLLSVVRDISDRRRSEEAIARLYEAELHARALAEEAVRVRDQFLTVAAHELRTPLTALHGNIQLLDRRARREGRLDDRELRTLTAIGEQARRLGVMMSTLLDVSRMETGQLTLEREPVDLGALARRIVEEVRPLAPRHRLQASIPDHPVVVAGDSLRLEQVLQNLVGNAVKYSPAGGEVGVRIEEAGGLVRVQVSDEGLGIPAEALPRLFQRFYRAENAARHGVEGSGIGLYVVRELVQLHGGAVEVESVEGRGSTFTVTLPGAPPAPADEPEAGDAS